MLKVTKEEILKKLVSISNESLNRIEVVEWAKPISESYPLNLVNLNDVVLEEAFKTLQISTLKMNELATEYCKMMILILLEKRIMITGFRYLILKEFSI
ncbi:hypothetical protein [Leptospira kirschneri]|uniref:hypothetical protein n=1 Tax=Leptospira kirschneri TaxID=29507 RepID=UPI00046C5BE1|nr:hypothetical protein [Leptospira kirschneri]